jgi:hypothetical protein
VLTILTARLCSGSARIWRTTIHTILRCRRYCMLCWRLLVYIDNACRSGTSTAFSQQPPDIVAESGRHGHTPYSVLVDTTFNCVLGADRRNDEVK